MRRRAFIAGLGGAAGWVVVARGQQAERIRHIGVLINGKNDLDVQAWLGGLRQGLERLGWPDGRNIRVDYRFGEGNPDRYQPLAKELVAMQPDVIVAQTPPVVAAVRQETGTIPIVFVDVSDPIGPGFVVSLARPGGNLTGMLNFEASVIGKWLAMLKEIAPNLARVALLGSPKTTAFDYFQQAAAALAPSQGIEVTPQRVETATDIERVLVELARVPDSGLMFPPSAILFLHRDLIIGLAARHRLPAIYPFRVIVAAGGLMSYSPDYVFQFRQAASYIDHILRGAKPGDLPVQTPTKFETALNLKTAKGLGLTVPTGLLLAADEVIE